MHGDKSGGKEEKPKKRRSQYTGNREYGFTPGSLMDRFCTNLARGMSVVDAGAAAGIPQATAYRRWAEPAVKQRVKDIRQGMLEGASGVLTAACGELSVVILELARDTDQQPAIRLKAAVEGLKAGSNLRLELETSRRLEKIEEMLGIKTPSEGDSEEDSEEGVDS